MVETILSYALSSTGAVGSVVMLIVGWVAKRYLVPFLQVAKRRQYALYISAIADDVTDDLRAKYPDKEWANQLDQAVDKIMDICNINRTIASRAAKAAVGRKK